MDEAILPLDWAGAGALARRVIIVFTAYYSLCVCVSCSLFSLSLLLSLSLSLALLLSLSPSLYFPLFDSLSGQLSTSRMCQASFAMTIYMRAWSRSFPPAPTSMLSLMPATAAPVRCAVLDSVLLDSVLLDSVVLDSVLLDGVV
jgi:hypothetical protein